MGQDIPKQFMHVDNCPIIIHTMMAFQKHPDIQGIAVVCLAGWETVLRSYANQFCITKPEMDIPWRKQWSGVNPQWYLWLERGGMR